MHRYPWLDSYLLAKAGATKDFKAEWGWHRYQVGGKMFAATCQPGPAYPAYDGRELLTLKCDPILAQALRQDYADIIPGFYMDKRNWNSLYLDGSLPEELLRDLCDQSYALVFAKLTKTLRQDIAAGAK